MRRDAPRKIVSTRSPSAPRGLAQPHRGDGTQDPYRPSRGGKTAVCPTCRLVFREKRWTSERRRKSRGELSRLCPACRKIRDGFSLGELNLSGPFLKEKREEIQKVLAKEETRARTVNPLERIVASRWDRGRLVVETTVPKLAQRLGRALYYSFKGKLEFHWGEEDTPTRVYWTR